MQPVAQIIPLPAPTLESAVRGAIGRLKLLRTVAIDEGNGRMILAAEMAMEALRR